MNRIYQGRVSKVLDDQNQELDLHVLWQHHELFQQAVNYYIVCLLALAGDLCAKQRDLRERMTTKPADNGEGPLYVWESFRRRGAKRRGLRDSVAPFLCPDNKNATPNECFAAVLLGNQCANTEEGRKLLDRGLAQMLSKCTGEGGCRDASKEYLPRYCDPDTKCTFGEDEGRLRRDREEVVFPFILHDPAMKFDSPELASFGIHSVAWPDGRKLEFRGAEAKAKLLEMLKRWQEQQPEASEDWLRLEQKIKALPDDLILSSFAATAAKSNPTLARNKMLRLYAMYFFRRVEQSEFTFGLLRATTPAPKPDAKRPESRTSDDNGGDPIRLARGDRGFVFRAFTNLPVWGGDASGKPKWLGFDRAAFCEALKALHQVDAKGIERDEEREQKEARHQYQRGTTTKWKSGGNGEDEQRPPVLKGDPRIARLEYLVDEELKDEYEMFGLSRLSSQ
jgi:hypothetical protein